MKRLIILSILLLAGPSLVSAQVDESFVATSGSMAFSVFDTGASFTVAGPDFSLSGGLGFSGHNPLSTTSPVGSLGAWAVGSTLELTLRGDGSNGGLSADVGGAPLPAAEFFVNFSSPPSEIPGGNSLPEPQPFHFDEPFQFEALIRNPAGPDCGFPTPAGPVKCWGFFGDGIVTLDAIPTAPNSNLVYILDATYTFTNPFASAPEPSIASLLLLGFAGLAVLGWRRRACGGVSWTICRFG